MAAVAVRRPQDFPEAGRLSGLKSCAASCSQGRMRRPRQVAPAGWTMCECEADKEWVLCDRVEAMAAEMAETLQKHLRDTKDMDTSCTQVPEKDRVSDVAMKKMALASCADAQFEAEVGMEEDDASEAQDASEMEALEEPSTETKLQTKCSDAKGTKEDLRAAKKTRAERKAAWRASQKALEGDGHKEVEESLNGKARGKARRSRRDQ
ncbi:Ctdspl2 [Symbiodinium natans]|uniref:Ctdspl2 protein n=1 Tax=Symbiodinium natans TaxID=878477 RepID=A0A812GTI2_9DINO|nr:Ctdspl2 [Symbiodinium natans]